MTATTLERTEKLVHDAFFYTDASSYRAGLLDFIRAGLANDEPVLVAVPQPGLGLVRSALTEDEEPRVRTRTCRWPAATRDGSSAPCSARSSGSTPGAGCGSSASRSGPAAAPRSTRPAPSTRR